MRTPPVGVPFVPGVLSRGTHGLELLKDCPACGETITCRERKDEESFTGREFAQHYLAHDGWRLISECGECGEQFPYARIVEARGAVYCEGCVDVMSEYCDNCGDPLAKHSRHVFESVPVDLDSVLAGESAVVCNECYREVVNSKMDETAHYRSEG